MDRRREKKLKRERKFFELYKQGLTYQQIGDKYGISRQRACQIISQHPDFESYKLEQEDEKLRLEKEKIIAKEQAKQDLYKRSIGFLYPERVADLWDYEKNGDLSPDKVLSRSSSLEIWLKCPIDGHSWKKKPSDIVAIWKYNKTSGCPLCAGRTTKAQKQPSLIEAYPNFVRQYWNYKKNQTLNLHPDILTCGSNKKAWLKCPYDNNEWQAQISTTVNQQWSRGNAGCCICNGTENRKKGTWQRREPIAIEFPDEVAKYWLYERNNEQGLDPMKLTARSNKEAFFKCPIDGYEWIATITAIAGTSWDKGNSGCPVCRGLVAIESTSLAALYPNFIQRYWNYEKNSKFGLYPDKLTKGSNKEAWFKCPRDGYEWKAKIIVIRRGSWDKGNSGCPVCRGRFKKP